MKEIIDYLSTLFVGNDIASRIHVISAQGFNQEYFIKMKPIENTQEGAVLLERMTVDVLTENHQFKYVVIGMESTGFYGVYFHQAFYSIRPVTVSIDGDIVKLYILEHTFRFIKGLKDMTLVQPGNNTLQCA